MQITLSPDVLPDLGHAILYCTLINCIIKCSSNCARCDWSVRVHYSSIKHAAYVTRVLYRVIMHAAYVTRAISLAFYKRKKNSSSCIVELYKHLGIFKNTREVREALGCASCFSMHFSRVLKNSRVLI